MERIFAGIDISRDRLDVHVREFYGIEVSPELISKVTDAVLDELERIRGR